MSQFIHNFRVTSVIQNIKDIFLNMSFRNKLFFVYLVIILFPTFISQYSLYYSVRKQLIDQTHFNIDNTINQINTNIENELNSYNQLSSLIYMDSTLMNYITNMNPKHLEFIDVYDYLDPYFTRILAANSNINSLTLYIDNPFIPSDGLYIKPMDQTFKNKPWLKLIEGSSGKIVYGPVYLDEENIYLIPIVRLLNFHHLNYPYGILELTIREQDIYSLIKKEDINKYIFITDKNGTIISTKDKNLLTKNISEILPVEDFTLNSTYNFDSTYNQEDVLVVYRSMANSWKTVALIPYKNFLAEVEQSSKKLLLISLTNIIIATLLIYIISKGFTKRIQLLTKHIKKVKYGDFDIHFEKMGRDEIGQLSHTFESMAKRLNELIQEVYKKEILKRKADMDVLQAQINPHFLYNTLSSISSLAIREKAHKVNEMVSLLSRFYRVSLNKGKKVITVEEEINVTKYYIAIQQVRFHGLLHISFDIDKSLYEYKTIKLILQPFVENCINHAIWNDDKGINILIKVHERDSHILFDIIDDGIGMSAKRIETIMMNYINKDSSYGVRNVHERIKLFFGDSYGIQIYSKLGCGTKVQIKIPMKKEF